jgi:hypothetical protein
MKVMLLNEVVKHPLLNQNSKFKHVIDLNFITSILVIKHNLP